MFGSNAAGKEATGGSYRFPRILFVNEFPPDSLAVADLVRQLLVGYPEERIAWWCWRSSLVAGLKDLKPRSIHRFHMPARLLPSRKAVALRRWITERIYVPLAARHLARTVATVKPDVVWVLLFSWPILIAQRALSGGARLHVSLWDMPDTRQWNESLGERFTARLLNGAFDLVRRADSFDGISHAMFSEIALHTGSRDGVLVHSGFEPEDLRLLELDNSQPESGVQRLAYVGSIISEAAFQEFIRALAAARASAATPVVLEFFGARGYGKREWFDSQWMVDHPVFPADGDLVRSLRRCSWGIVVVDPLGEDLRYSRFSFPNKIGTYLSAGVPVLGIGQSGSPLAEVVLRHRVGLFSSKGNRAELEEFLTEALREPSPRARFRESILQCARAEFNAQVIRHRLWRAWGWEGGGEAV